MSSFFSNDTAVAGQDKPASGVRIFYAAGILMSGFLMVYAAQGDLWLDEIWSILFVETAKTPWEILSVYKNDSNHILNTIFLYLIGKQQNLLFYRMFAILSGIGSLVLLIKIASRWGHLESMFVLLLAGTSYPLILYFSEARGYAPAILFSLLSLYLLHESHIRPGPVKLVLFWIVSILGFLAHLTFIIVFLSLVVYIIHYEFSVDRTFIIKSWQVVKYLSVPAVFIISFYFSYIRDIAIGGGPHVDKYAELVRGITCLLGLPESLWFAGLLIIALLLSFVAYMAYADKKPIWSFYLSVLIIVPAVVITVTNPAYFHFRYIIVCFPYYYLIVSFILAKTWRANKKITYVAVLIIGLYIAGQSLRLWPLFQYGRGSYQAIISEMANASAANVIIVGSDNDFRNRAVLFFYARFLRGGKTIQYVDQASWSIQPPEWLILHSLDEFTEPEPLIKILTDRTYRLIKTEKFSGNSGFSWFLYHESNQSNMVSLNDTSMSDAHTGERKRSDGHVY